VNNTEYSIQKLKYLIEISYDGTNYAGWQNQPNKISVQQVIEDKLSHLYNGKISIRGAGRTDAGVHAVSMMAVFTPPSKPCITLYRLLHALNCLLPDSICIKKITAVDHEFDPRFDAFAKAYTYVICKKNINPRPFLSKWSISVKNSLNLDSISKGASFFIGEHDFSSFTVNLTKTKKNPMRLIYRIDVNEFDQFICITFIGKSFLYKMIRCLTGTLIEVGEGKVKPEEIQMILNAKDRRKGHTTAQPSGLFLVKLFYEEGSWEHFKLDRLPFLMF